MAALSGAEEHIAHHVRGKVTRLQSQYAAGPGAQPTSWAAQSLANLRRANPLAVGDDPAVWELVFDGMSTALMGHEDAPSRSERMIHAALCLYAHHQQSQTHPVHEPGARPGLALGRLARARASSREELSPGVAARVHATATATTAEKRLHELRGLILLMRAERPPINLDYGLLAVDLYRLDQPGTAPWVRLGWARDLHRKPHCPEDASAARDTSVAADDDLPPSTPHTSGAI